MFVVLEGIDGSGKSTLQNHLKRSLAKYKFLPEIVFTREPGGTVFGENIRNVLLLEEEISPNTIFLLMQAARIEHINTVIRPALEQGKIVISDRYFGSSIAYQGAQGVSKEFMLSVLEDTETIMPDLCFFLNISIEEAQKRKKTKENYFDEKTKVFFDEVLNNYFTSVNMAFNNKTFYWDVDNLSIEEVSDNFIETFMEYYYKYYKNKPYYIHSCTNDKRY
jgi:dTMP kinase